VEVAFTGGACALRNRNTAVLVFLSMITGLSMYGFLGMYPTFLREYLRYSPAETGKGHEPLRASARWHLSVAGG